MADTRIESNVYVTGSLQAATLVPSLLCVRNTHVATDAAIVYTKMEHVHQITYAQPNTTATAVTQVMHVVRGATANLLSVCAGSIAIAVGAATCTVDIKKNGSTMLTGVITLDSGNVAYTPEAGTVASLGALVVGDVITVVTTATAGGGTIPTGLYVHIKVREDAA